MRKLPLIFLLGGLMNPSEAFFFKNKKKHQAQPSANNQTATQSAASGYLSNGEEYSIAVRESINAARRNGDPDRLILYTGQENIFKFITRPGDHRLAYGTGRDFLSKLAEHPGKCIPNLTILSHGWGASRTSGGQGLPIAENSENGFPITGMYTDEDARLAEVQRSVDDYYNRSAEVIAQEAHNTAYSQATQERFRNINGRYPTTEEIERLKQIIIARSRDKNALFQHYNNISKPNSSTLADLAQSIRKKDIKFCNSCLIQIYSCNLDNDFAVKFAQTTGCQLVYGTGKVRGGYKRNPDGSLYKVNGAPVDDNTGASAHILTSYKSSTQVKDPVTGKNKYINMNTRDGSFQRITPIRGTNQVEQVSIGNTYELIK